MTSIAEKIKNIFDPFFEAPLGIWETFATYLDVRHYKKNEVIKAAHSAEKALYIISDGSAGIFLWKEHNPVCVDLCYENEFFGDYMSLLTGKESPLFTMALENTEMFAIVKEDLHKLYREEIGTQIARIAAESLFIQKEQQQIELLTLTAEQRYHLMLEKQPHIIKRTHQKHIASYLGISPESLSRIRKQAQK